MYICLYRHHISFLFLLLFSILCVSHTSLLALAATKHKMISGVYYYYHTSSMLLFLLCHTLRKYLPCNCCWLPSENFICLRVVLRPVVVVQKCNIHFICRCTNIEGNSQPQAWGTSLGAWMTDDKIAAQCLHLHLQHCTALVLLLLRNFLPSLFTSLPPPTPS